MINRAIAFVIFMNLANYLFAYEVPENPDRYISFAGGIKKASLDGDNSIKKETQDILLSIRVPFSRMATLDLNYNLLTDNQHSHTQNIQQNFSGSNYGALLRIYIIPDSPAH